MLSTTSMIVLMAEPLARLPSSSAVLYTWKAMVSVARPGPPRVRMLIRSTWPKVVMMSSV